MFIELWVNWKTRTSWIEPHRKLKANRHQFFISIWGVSFYVSASLTFSCLSVSSLCLGPPFSPSVLCSFSPISQTTLSAYSPALDHHRYPGLGLQSPPCLLVHIYPQKKCDWPSSSFHARTQGGSLWIDCFWTRRPLLTQPAVIGCKGGIVQCKNNHPAPRELGVGYLLEASSGD